MSIAMLRRGALLASLLVPMSLAACASQPAEENGEYDPLESVNRPIFSVNQGIDTVLIRPIAVTYRDVVPDQIKTIVENFLSFVHTPVVLINDLLQGDLARADITAQRFMQNLVTLGTGDPASQAGLPPHPADFGLTLARWGVKDGPYVVIPVLGPSNVRDGIGLAVDTLLDPLTWVAHADSQEGIGYGDLGARLITARAASIKDLDQVKEQSLDFYASMRSLYKQYRDGQIRQMSPSRSENGPTYYELMSPALLVDPNSTTTSSVEQ